MFEHKNIEGIKFRTFFKFDEDSSIPLSDQRGSLKGRVSHSVTPVFVSRLAKNRNLSHSVSVRVRWAPKFTFFVRVSMDYFHFSHNGRIGLRTLKPQINYLRSLYTLMIMKISCLKSRQSNLYLNF